MILPEHGQEPQRGLPGRLPKGERILWQGRPSTVAMARHVFLVGPVMAYFALLAAFWMAEAWVMDAPIGEAAIRSVWLVPFAAAAVAILMAMAWAFARATVYTITNRRVVIRHGVAIQMAVNLPFAEIEGAAVKDLGEGTGTIALEVKDPRRVGYLHLWPHVRPWRMANPSPALRCVADVPTPARILSEALAAYHEQPAAARMAAAQTSATKTPEAVPG